MTGKIVFVLLLLMNMNTLCAQDKVFGKKELETDLAYLQQQIKEVHADPLRELDEKKWQDLFSRMHAQLKDSMTQSAFFSVIKPAVAFLSDEHADIAAPAYFEQHDVFLPFSLRALGNGFVCEAINDANKQTAQMLIAVNGISIAILLKELSNYTTGFPEERMAKALEQFGYLYGLAHPFETAWTLTLAGQKETKVLPTSLKNWTEQIKRLNGMSEPKQRMRYESFGNIGYFTVPDFSVRNDADGEKYSRAIDSAFTQAIQNGVQQFVIDVSRNSGGNSIVGDMMIDHFYSKPYKSYQMSWRRSKEYLALMKKFGSNNPSYEALQPGAVLHYDAGTVTPSDETPK